MPYSLENKTLAREFLAKIRAKTFCKECGRQPVDFHRQEHEVDGNLRVSRMAARGHPIDVIQAEIDKCTALCRSCHMKEDGRLDALSLNKPRQNGVILVGPKPCIICGAPSKPTRKGKCRHCYDEIRRSKLVPI
jgi:hypothetical protein